MLSLIQSLLGGNGQMSDIAINWIAKHPNTIALCKTMNWDVNSFCDTIKGGFGYLTNSYKERPPFAKTEQQRLEDTKKVYLELKGYECLDETERMILACKTAGFNAKETFDGLKLESTLSVEQVANIGMTAQEKYLKVAKMAGVGATTSSVEQSSNINLKEIFESMNTKPS
jgi:hypothetical protein